MTSTRGPELADVKALYEGWQRRLFALLMGQQLHAGPVVDGARGSGGHHRGEPRRFGYDALEIVDFDRDVFRALQGQLAFLGGLARARKLAQARFVARKG
jgi:hypothetical protein